jgi:hypothetical protein
MATFVVSYELRSRRCYPQLLAALRSRGGVRLLEGSWLLETPAEAEEILVTLKELVDDGDSVLVVEVKAGAHWSSWRTNPAGNNKLALNVRGYPAAA